MRCPNSTEPTARTTAPKGDVPPGRRVVGVRSASAPRPGHRGSRGHSRAGTGDRHTHRERIHARTGYRWAPRPTCDRHTTAVQCAGPLRWFASPDRTAGDGVQPTPRTCSRGGRTIALSAGQVRHDPNGTHRVRGARRPLRHDPVWSVDGRRIRSDAVLRNRGGGPRLPPQGQTASSRAVPTTGNPSATEEGTRS